MTPPMTDIIAAIEKRLAELDAEIAKLRAMLAAAKGEAPAVATPVFVPYPVPSVPPVLPWRPGGWPSTLRDFTITTDGTGTGIVPCKHHSIGGSAFSIDERGITIC